MLALAANIRLCTFCTWDFQLRSLLKATPRYLIQSCLLKDGCAVNLDVDLLYPQPGCSHYLGLSNVHCQFVRFNPGSNEL